MISRRGIIGVLSGLIAAPSIVKATSLMPVKTVEYWNDSPLTLDDYAARVMGPTIEKMKDNFARSVMSQSGNSLLTIDQITRGGVKLFRNSNLFLQNIDRQYDDTFAADGARIGGTLRIRLPNDYVMSDGPANRLDVLYGSMQMRPEWATVVAEHKEQVAKEVWARALAPQAPPPASEPTLSAPAAIALGAAAVVVANPVVSRRFWK